MSEQGKKRGESIGAVVGNGVEVRIYDGCQAFADSGMVAIEPSDTLIHQLKTAETAATEYAKQAAELQEEVERLREGVKFFLSVRHEYHRTRRGVKVYDDAVHMLESLSKTEAE